MSQPLRQLLLIGGGHSHVEVLRRFGLQPMADVTLILVSPDRFTPYSGMLPGWIAGHYDFGDCHIDLDRVCAFARGTFHKGRVTALDPVRRLATLDDGSTIAFDIVSIDTGSTPPLGAVRGMLEHATPVKPVDRFLQAIEALTSSAALPHRIAVIGAGAAGLEVLLSVQYRLGQRAPNVAHQYAVVTATPTILPSHSDATRRAMGRVLERRGVNVLTGFDVRAIERTRIVAGDGRELEADFVIAATGAEPATWPRHSGLSVDARGFIAVDERLQSISHPCVFAAGDVASITDHSYPKSGVYAVRQGPVLAGNLRKQLRGEALDRYVPQAVSLALISTGDRHAVASRGRWCIAGRWVWRWKDYIDRKFMRTYGELQAGV